MYQMVLKVKHRVTPYYFRTNTVKHTGECLSVLKMCLNAVQRCEGAYVVDVKLYKDDSHYNISHLLYQ